jgi:integrase
VKQVRAFLAHLRGHRLHAAFLLSCCGLRRGEVLGLQLPAVVLTGGAPRADGAVEPVQVGNEVLEHGPKSRASRSTLPLPEPVSLALAGLLMRQRRERATAGRAYRPGCPRSGQVHIGGRRAGPAVPAQVLHRRVRPAGAGRRVAAGPVARVRHAAASLLGSMGVPILHVAASLGQSQSP